MLDRATLGFLNHLLGEESWARARLKPFAGSHGRIEAGPMSIGFVVEGDGQLRYAEAPTSDVTIRLPDDALLRLATDRGSIAGAAHLTGNADFAEALGFVMRNLRWDIEADLARVVGDIPARRIVLGAQSFVGERVDSVRRAGDNLLEFAIGDGDGFLVHADELQRFPAEVISLGKALERLESRLR